MKKNKNDMLKIRMIMDERYYHLHEDIKWDEENKLIETWKLYEKHDYWLTDGSKPIMTSKENTYEELYKFVKKNRNIDVDKTIGITELIIINIFLIIAFINLKFHNELLRGTIIGVDLTCIIISFVRLEVSEKNFKFKMKRYNERWKKILEGENENKTNDISER